MGEFVFPQGETFVFCAFPAQFIAENQIFQLFNLSATDHFIYLSSRYSEGFEYYGTLGFARDVSINRDWDGTFPDRQSERPGG